jgi:prevent-host-death family protein
MNFRHPCSAGANKLKASLPSIGSRGLILTEYSISLVQIGGSNMTVIKSISSLRNRTREISRICREQDIPVYLTRNGEGELVVTSIDHYERLKAQADLFSKLGVARSQAAAGKKGITHRQMISKLRQRLNAR